MTHTNTGDAGTDGRTPDRAVGGKWENTPYGPLWTASGSEEPGDGAQPVTGSRQAGRGPDGDLRVEAWTRHRAASGRIEDELEPGERLLWHGRPVQGLRLGLGPDLGGAVGLLFFLGWTGFAGVGAARNLAAGDPAGDVLIPALMAGAGLAAIAYLLWLEPRGRAKTTYGLTDRRAIIVSGQARLTVESVYLRAVRTVTLREHRDGSGSGTGTLAFADFVRSCGEDDCSPEFQRIRGARHVHGLILAHLPDRNTLRS